MFRNMLVLASGVGGSRLVVLLSVPLLTRIYSPHDFGLLAVFTSFVALLVPCASLRYVILIPLPKTDRLAAHVIALSLTILLILGTIEATVFYLFSDQIFPFFSADSLARYWWLIVIATICTSLYEILTLWATRKKAFKEQSLSLVSQSIVGSAVKILLGLAGVIPLGLLIGQTVQQAGGFYILARRLLADAGRYFRRLDLETVLFLMRWHADVPLMRVPSQFLLVIATQAPVLFFASSFGAAVAGQLSVAMLALSVPVQLLGATTGQAYYAEIASIGKRNPRKIREITLSVIKRLFAFSIVPGLAFLFLAPLLFRIVLGQDWQQAGHFASYLSLYFVAQFVCSPIVHIFSVLDRQDLYLRINLIRTAVIGLVFGCAYWLAWDVEKTILVYSLSLTVHYIIVLLQTISVIPNQQTSSARRKES